MHLYNTRQTQIVLKEYGRNIQLMVQKLMTIEDREKRNQQANVLVEIMKTFIQGNIKDAIDINNKVWDDLYTMSGYQLDVDSPYPKPEPAKTLGKTDRMKYSYSMPKLKHYGKNVELVIQKIKKMEPGEEKENAIIYAGRLMKNFYQFYSKDTLEDKVIKQQLEFLSNNELTIDLDKVRNENLFEVLPKDRKAAGSGYPNNSINNGLAIVQRSQHKQNNNLRKRKRK